MLGLLLFLALCLLIVGVIVGKIEWTFALKIVLAAIVVILLAGYVGRA